jgi:DNA-binding MarR family transcriptional regulator
MISFSGLILQYTLILKLTKYIPVRKFKKGDFTMSNFKDLCTTNREMHILTILHKFRGLTVDQLVRELCLELNRPVSKTFKYNTYKILKSLEQSKHIIKESIRLHRTIDFIYLSEHGTERVAEHLDIMPYHIGSGWNDDHGDFPFPLQKPPKTPHHLLMTEVLLELQKLKMLYPDWQLDYRDNRYCAQLYNWEGKEYVFRPDAAIRLGEEIFLVEVDRGTEYLEKLKEKFEGYHRYFSYLKQNDESIPSGVIFVSDKKTGKGFNRRWALIQQAFYTEMSQWYTNFNLMACNDIQVIQNMIIRHITRNVVFNDFWKKINYYTRNDNIQFGTLKDNIGWNNSVMAIVQTESGPLYYGFERVEEFETIGLCRLYVFCKHFGNTNKNFKQVRFYTEGSATKHVLKGFEHEGYVKILKNKLIWLNVKEAPKWFNKDGHKININNPLLPNC